MRKSASGSKPPQGQRIRVRRTRTLKRGASYRPLEKDDWKYLWAAHRQGGFEKPFEALRAALGIQEPIPTDLPGDEFKYLMETVMEGGEFWILTARNLEENMPVGIVGGIRKQEVLEPHVEWFPWATPRNKIETIVVFIEGMRNNTSLLIYTDFEERNFWIRMAQYGVVRRVGTYFRRDGKVWWIWQERRSGGRIR